MCELLLLPSSPQGQQHRARASREPEGMKAIQDFLAPQACGVYVALLALRGCQGCQGHQGRKAQLVKVWSTLVLPSLPPG